MTRTTWAAGEVSLHHCRACCCALLSLGWICSTNKVCWYLMPAKNKNKKCFWHKQTLGFLLHLCLRPFLVPPDWKETPHTLLVSLNISLARYQPPPWWCLGDVMYFRGVGCDKLLHQRCHVCAPFASFCALSEANEDKRAKRSRGTFFQWRNSHTYGESFLLSNQDVKLH